MVHHSSSNAEQMPRKRRRTPRSCQECRRSKTKYDRNQPCSLCILTAKQCFFRIRPATADSLSSTVAPPSYQQPTPQDPGLSQNDQELERLRSRVRSLEEALHQRDSGADGAAIRTPSLSLSHASEPHDLSPQEEPIALNKSRLFGQSHWTTSAALEFRGIVTILNGEAAALTTNNTISRLISDNRLLLQRCKLLSKTRKASEQGSSLPPPDLTLQINKLYADHMVQLYTSHFESAFRILHVPSFWTEYERCWESAPATATALQLKVQLVVALGSSLRHGTPKQTTSPLRHLVCHWLQAAQNWLTTTFEKSRLSIDSLQIHCLLVLARQALAVGGDLVHVDMGSILRTAMQMGLHRDPRHFKSMDLFETEMRRRLWATILELNLQASLDAGMTPNLSCDDFDTEPPSNIDDADISRGASQWQKDPGDVVTDSSLQCYLSHSVRLRYEVVQRMNGIDATMSYDEIRASTSDIIRICREMKRLVKDDGPAAVFRCNLADMLVRRLLLCIHRPLASQSHTTPELYLSRKVSLDAAMALLSPANNDEFSLLTYVGGGMFKTRMIHVSLAVASELLRELRETGTTTEPTGYRRMVVDAVKEALGQTAERIRLGQTDADVKMHIKLSMAICQASDASSSSVEASLLLLAQSAKQSLEWSYSVLQARVPEQVGEENTLARLEDADLPNFTTGSDFDFDDIFGMLDMDEPFSLPLG